jgi:hypothetical protein
VNGRDGTAFARTEPDPPNFDDSNFENLGNFRARRLNSLTRYLP